MNNDVSPRAILKELIAIPSQNPMGHERTGTGWFEQNLSEWLCRFLAGHNVAHEYHQIESNRGNVVAWVKGNSDRPPVLLDAHQDTVPAIGMTIDPFRAVENDGRLYGRGACDVKGAMACMLATLVRITRATDGSHPNVYVSLTCDEELGQLGARELVKRITNKDCPFAEPPQMAIVAEPTDLNVVVAHKGTVRWKIVCEGRACHSSRPDKGSNAIYKMARVLSELERMAEELATDGPEHALCGKPTISVGTIQGGESVNIVPERCEIEIDRRVVPGESIDAILDETLRALTNRLDVDFRFLPPSTTCEPLSDDANHSLADSLIAASSRVVASRDPIGVAFTTQAPKFAAAGLPTVVFGPGSISQAHTKDEWILTEQLDQAAEILFEFLMQR